MPQCRQVARPLARPLAQCLGQGLATRPLSRPNRSFSSRPAARSDAVAETAATISSAPPPPPPPPSPPPTQRYDPLTVTDRVGERLLANSGTPPIGSRRRRAALKTSQNIPFELLPYRCFQQARKVLREDREEKLRAIELLRARAQLIVAAGEGEVGSRASTVRSLQREIERLKILADINDPMIKKRFEDGDGDMSKPIYRYLADKKWRAFARLVVMQRIAQLGVVPDVLPPFEPTADVRLAFRRRAVQPGAFVDSLVSEAPARLGIQVFDGGARLVSIAVVDPDVPDAASDAFASRCLFLAANVRLDPTATSAPLTGLAGDAARLVLPWLPPHAQKGAPYHRIAVFVLQQPDGRAVDAARLRAQMPGRDGFDLRSFVAAHRMTPVGVNVFRARWDEGTAQVMARAGIDGADIEFKRKKVVALKPKEQPRGWDAKHAKAKYKPIFRKR